MYTCDEIEKRIFLAQYRLWHQHFESTEDRKTKVWLLSTEKSPFISSTYDFNSGSIGISIIDPFNGRRPWLLTYDTTVRGDNVGLYPTVLLDSQVINRLDAYLKNQNSNSHESNSTRQFLRFVVERNYDYNLAFYYMESVLTSGIEITKRIGKKAANVILQLHTMDQEVFLQNGRIIPDRKRCRVYAKRYGLNSIDCNFYNEIATLMTNQMLENAEKIRENLRFIADYTYTILLKIVLINSSQNLAITEKMQELCSFVENQFDLLLGREHAIAAYYFSKQLPSKFIPFKVKDISFEEVCRRLDSTARDFCLLRLPETLLFAGNEQATRLGFPCSAENAIRKIGRLITIKNAISLSDNYLPTEIEIDIETLQQELGEEVIETLQNQQQRLNNIRLQAQVEQKRIPISHEQLQELIAELEKQVQPFCKE